MKTLIIIALLVLGSVSYGQRRYDCIPPTNSNYPAISITEKADSLIILETVNDSTYITYAIVRNEENYVVEREDYAIELHLKDQKPRLYGRVIIDPITAYVVLIECFIEK